MTSKSGIFSGIDEKAIVWGWVIALFGVKMVWLPGSIVNLLVNCAGVRRYTPDVYSKILLALIPTFNGWSSLMCVVAGVLTAAYLAEKLKMKHALCVLGLACLSYAVLVSTADYIRPFVH